MGFLDKLFGKSKEMENMSNVKLAVIFYSMGGTNYWQNGLNKEQKKPVLK